MMAGAQKPGQKEDAVWQMFTTLACWNFGAAQGVSVPILGGGGKLPARGRGELMAAAVTAVPHERGGDEVAACAATRPQHGSAMGLASKAQSLVPGCRANGSGPNASAAGLNASCGGAARQNGGGSAAGAALGGGGNVKREDAARGVGAKVADEGTAMAEWLRVAGLAEFIPAFQREGMDMDALAALKMQLPAIDGELRNVFQMSRYGDRLKFKVRRHTSPSPRPNARAHSWTEPFSRHATHDRIALAHDTFLPRRRPPSLCSLPAAHRRR